jgi:hypothetical protein
MVKLLQKDNFAIGTLSVCGVLKSIKDFLQGECLACLSVGYLPDVTICSTANLPNYLITAQNVSLDVFSHVIILIIFLLVCGTPLTTVGI